MQDEVIIDNIYLLMAAIVQRANSDVIRSSRNEIRLSKTCEATAIEHSAKDCAREFLEKMEEYRKGDLDWTAVDYCLGVIKLWQQ